MRILLNYKGWFKYMDCPEYMVKAGSIVINLESPHFPNNPALPKCTAPSPDDKIYTVRLFHSGRLTTENIPVFEEL